MWNSQGHVLALACRHASLKCSTLFLLGSETFCFGFDEGEGGRLPTRAGLPGSGTVSAALGSGSFIRNKAVLLSFTGKKLCCTYGFGSGPGRRDRKLISHKVSLTSCRESQFPHKSANTFFISAIVKDKMIDLWGELTSAK